MCNSNTGGFIVDSENDSQLLTKKIVQEGNYRVQIRFTCVPLLMLNYEQNYSGGSSLANKHLLRLGREFVDETLFKSIQSLNRFI